MGQAKNVFAPEMHMAKFAFSPKIRVPGAPWTYLSGEWPASSKYQELWQLKMRLFKSHCNVWNLKRKQAFPLDQKQCQMDLYGLRFFFIPDASREMHCFFMGHPPPPPLDKRLHFLRFWFFVLAKSSQALIFLFQATRWVGLWLFWAI